MLKVRHSTYLSSFFLSESLPSSVSSASSLSSTSSLADFFQTKLEGLAVIATRGFFGLVDGLYGFDCVVLVLT